MNWNGNRPPRWASGRAAKKRTLDHTRRRTDERTDARLINTMQSVSHWRRHNRQHRQQRRRRRRRRCGWSSRPAANGTPHALQSKSIRTSTDGCVCEATHALAHARARAHTHTSVGNGRRDRAGGNIRQIDEVLIRMVVVGYMPAAIHYPSVHLCSHLSTWSVGRRR
jgi:hypothetical protein